MIDIKRFRENPKEYEQSAKLRGAKVDFARISQLDERRLKLIQEVDSLRSQLKVEGKPDEAELAKLQKIKTQLEAKEQDQANVQGQLDQLMATVPNLLAPKTPEGGEESNKVVREWGEPSKQSGKDHLEFMEERGWVDFERGAKVAGSKFYYLKGDAVWLEKAIIDLAMVKAQTAGFVPMSVPHVVNERISRGTGFTPKGPEDQVYSVEGEDLHLIATAEVPLTGYHADEIIPEPQLPLKYVALSPAYRKEAGAYGKHSKGLFRVHQFNKLELYVFCKPEDSDEQLQKLVELEEEIVKALEIPYRVTRTATGDMGQPHYEKYDIEYWSPADGEYRELTSASNCTDFQARRLNIRTKTADGNVVVHTLNATAAALSRVPVALIENHQKSGKLIIPKALREHFGGIEAL